MLFTLFTKSVSIFTFIKQIRAGGGGWGGGGWVGGWGGHGVGVMRAVEAVGAVGGTRRGGRD